VFFLFSRNSFCHHRAGKAGAAFQFAAIRAEVLEFSCHSTDKKTRNKEMK
jgi:hypothetical protein